MFLFTQANPKLHRSRKPRRKPHQSITIAMKTAHVWLFQIFSLSKGWASKQKTETASEFPRKGPARSRQIGQAWTAEDRLKIGDKVRLLIIK